MRKPGPKKFRTSEIEKSYTAKVADSEKASEKNDCAVIAVSLATGVSYAKAHAVLAKNGRENGKGVNFEKVTKKALAELGYKAVKVNPETVINKYPGVHKTLKNITTHHPNRFPKAWGQMKGNFLARTRSGKIGQLTAIVDGKNYDHTVRNAKRVISLYRVVKKG